MCTSAASQLCCLAAVVGLLKFCFGFCRCRAPLGSSRQTLWWISCASFGSLSCTSSAASTATSRIGPPASTTRNLDMEKHIAQVSAQDPHTMLSCSCRDELVCEPLVDTTFKKLGEHEWRNGDQKMNARVNVTSESALLPLLSGCPPERSSTEAEPTMLQATWREQAHRAGTHLRLTCLVTAQKGPRGPSFVKHI